MSGKAEFNVLGKRIANMDDKAARVAKIIAGNGSQTSPSMFAMNGDAPPPRREIMLQKDKPVCRDIVG